MTIERELARVRAKASGEAINRRHRRAREAAARMQADQKEPAAANGVNPDFAAQIEAAKKRVKAFNEHRDEGPIATQRRIARLRLEGKLPPATVENVGYEPTAEEVLGDLAMSETETEDVQHVPTAEEVLNTPQDDEDPEPEESGETEALTHQQLNPALRGALQKAALETDRPTANPSNKRSKRHKRR